MEIKKILQDVKKIILREGLEYEGGNYYCGIFSKESTFKKGDYKNKTGYATTDAVFNGNFGKCAGIHSINSKFINGNYLSETGKYTEDATIENGKYGDFTGIESKYLKIENGKFGKGTAKNSKNSIILGSSFGEKTLRNAENVKAYIPKAKSIINPRSGIIISDKVKEIRLSEPSYDIELHPNADPDLVKIFNKVFKNKNENIFVYTTKDNVSGIYAENSAYIDEKDLQKIIEEVDLDKIKESLKGDRGYTKIEELDMIMDYLICKVDEKSKAWN